MSKLNIVVILAHPNNQSFNHTIADTAVVRLEKNGHNVIYHDLCEEHFDLLLSFNEILP